MELLQDLNRDYRRYSHSPRERTYLGLNGLQHIQSSNVSSVGVKGESLIIRFHNGSMYEYPNQASQYESMLKSNSKGKWVWRNLRRKNVLYRKIGVLPLPDDIGVTDEEIFQEIDNRYMADLTRHVDVPVFQSFEFIKGINYQKIQVGNINVYKAITEPLPLTPTPTPTPTISVDTQEAVGVQGRNIIAETIPTSLEVDPFQLPKEQYEVIFNDLKPHIQKQGFDKVPKLVGKAEFKEARKNSGVTLFRGYYGEAQQNGNFIDTTKSKETVEKFRLDMEKGDFFVDNTGGAAYGRGMYFAYSDNENKKELETAYKTAEFYGRKQNAGLSRDQGNLLAQADGVRIDKATLADDTKIITTESLQTEYEQYILKNYFNEQEQKKVGLLVELSRQKRDFITQQYDLGFSPKIRSQYTKQQIDDKIDELTKEIRLINSDMDDIELTLDEPLREKYNNFNTYREEVDNGIKATTLGYDAILVEENNYLVLVNRTKLILLDDNGEYNDNIDDLDI